jgi:hypothetical protein
MTPVDNPNIRVRSCVCWRPCEFLPQQPGTPVYGPGFVATEVQRALSQASRERPVEFRAQERKGISA